MCKRTLSHLEEKIIRAVHHDFEGLSIKEVAQQNDLTVKEVKTILTDIEQKAPQLFPILTPRQRAIMDMYNQHESQQVIAEALGIAPRTLRHDVTFLRERGFLWGKPDQYRPSMDGNVKHKF